VAAFDWAPRATGIFLFWAGGLAILGFTLAWWALSLDPHVQRPDLGFYQGVGEAIQRGLVPYRDFDPVYPPASLPILGLPSLLGAEAGRWEGYAVRFEHLMLIVGWLAVLSVLFALVALGASRRRVALGLGFVAVSPLMVGSIVVARYDLWPAALATAGLGAVIAGRERLGSGVIGVAIMAKVYPIVLVPLVLAYVWRRVGGRAAVGAAASAVAGAALAAMPFLVIAPPGLWDSLMDFARRPLQVESAGAALIWIAHDVADVPINVVAGFGSDNLVGPLPDVAVAIQSLVLVVTLGFIWARFARDRTPSADGLILAGAAAVCAFIVFGKVLSGQYLIWLIPFAALLRGTRGAAAAAIVAAALVLTQQWYPVRYPAWVYGFDPSVAWIVLVRDIVLAVLLVVLVAPARWAADAAGWFDRRLGRTRLPVAAGRAGLGTGPAVQPAYLALDRRQAKE
jgi:hypothetical protein